MLRIITIATIKHNKFQQSSMHFGITKKNVAYKLSIYAALNYNKFQQSIIICRKLYTKNCMESHTPQMEAIWVTSQSLYLIILPQAGPVFVQRPKNACKIKW